VADHDQDTAVTDVHGEAPSTAGADCLVVIHHEVKSERGKRIDLGAGRVRVGRHPDNELVLEGHGISRHHVRLEKRDSAWVVMDVGSTNGTLLNDGEIDGVRELRTGDRIKVGSVILKYLSGSDVERDFHEEIYSMTITDGLTRLHNKLHFSNEFAKEFSRARRHARPLSLLILDLDRFKKINDRYGHPAGDTLLAHVAGVLKARVRSHEIVARFGGEEFVVLLPETRLTDAAVLAEALRASVAASTLQYRTHRLRVTLSIGCAELALEDSSEQSLLERADQKLYLAKNSGRNRVES